MRLPVLLSVAIIAIQAQGALAAGGDGTWPCVQRKVPSISQSAVWTKDPPGENAAKLKDDPEIAELAARLSARRIDVKEAGKLVSDYAGRLAADKDVKLKALFLALFERLNGERSDVMAGIERYGRKQLQFADRLRQQQEELAAKRQEANADPSEIQDLNDQLVWDTRIFEDRRKSLTYVCEVPVIIEQRLFALAKAIETEIK